MICLGDSAKLSALEHYVVLLLQLNLENWKTGLIVNLRTEQLT